MLCILASTLAIPMPLLHFNIRYIYAIYMQYIFYGTLCYRVTNTYSTTLKLSSQSMSRNNKFVHCITWQSDEQEMLEWISKFGVLRGNPFGRTSPSTHTTCKKKTLHYHSEYHCNIIVLGD